MVALAAVEAGITVAEAIVSAIVKISPQIISGAMSAEPYVRAIAGLITGGNATQEQIDQALASINAATAQFQQPLPPDDGTTTS